MLNIKNLTIAMLLAGFSALSFAQAQAAASKPAPYAEAGAANMDKNAKKKPKKTPKDASADDPSRKEGNTK